MANTLQIPFSPPIELSTGDWRPEWREWIQSPTFISIDTGQPLPVASGGTGLAAAPGLNQFLTGDGSGNYTLTSTIPTVATPAYTGDVTKPAGSGVLTIATIGGLVAGAYGTANSVATVTVNVKGQVLAIANTGITGAPGPFTATGAFGCNGKTAQNSAVVNAAIAGTAGAAYTATEQGLINSLLALVNQLRAALVANGIAL